MSKYEQVRALATKWEGCTKCDLSKDRPGEPVILFGPTNCDLLIVTEAPAGNHQTAMGPEESQMLLDITTKLNIDRQKTTITHTVGCQPKANEFAPVDCVVACRPRLIDIVELTNPKVVILLGSAAYFSWTGNKERLVAEELGEIQEDTFREVIWSYDFSRYIREKNTNKDVAAEMGLKIFEHWKWVAEKLK